MGRTSTAPLQLQEALIELIWEQSYAHVTIDAICEKAKVKKGSFYYFYKSKGALALDAFDHHWETVSRPNLDRIFSVSKPPQQRLQDWLSFGYQKVLTQKKEQGQIKGCPFFNIGQETSKIEPEVSAKIGDFLSHFVNYIAATLRDAKESSQPEIKDPEALARTIFSLAQGSLTQARILNSPAPLADLPEAVSRLSGLEIASHPKEILTA
ncbi:TetR/AcrR family transcriptional regulator [Roseibacillus persicicus]|uniref:TetR family transcriptional regulator n=1 Tax=Roseibacillus persicicus TaxID=454148 RepID=A0A918WJK3_9BACT|nr:TetR/AcrR family transcriptional regulator [Roseibacillus persicicus]GHC48812.1 TetR family transcriptional regulator [Roseibacillus persicicus]